MVTKAARWMNFAQRALDPAPRDFALQAAENQLMPFSMCCARALIIALRCSALALAASPLAALAATPSQSAITCTNPASGKSWQIKIDYIAKTVDANAAEISDAKISWHDAKDGGNYSLDRKSGALTFVAPSSTGGYFVFDRCSLENPG
jgi:hypothetical protein